MSCRQGRPEPLREHEGSIPPMRAAIAVLLFLFVAAIASSTGAHQWDQAITAWLQHAAPAPDWPASIFVFLGDAEVLVTATVLAGLVLLSRDRPRGIAALRFAAGLAVVSILAVLLKYLIPHPGPPLSRQRHILRFGIPALTRFSLPSGHTMRATFIALTRFSLPSGHTMRATFIAGTALRRHAVSAGAVVLCMMAALVYLGDHWTTDVLAGLCLGWACVEVARRLT